MLSSDCISASPLKPHQLSQFGHLQSAGDIEDKLMTFHTPESSSSYLRNPLPRYFPGQNHWSNSTYTYDGYISEISSSTSTGRGESTSCGSDKVGQKLNQEAQAEAG